MPSTSQGSCCEINGRLILARSGPDLTHEMIHPLRATYRIQVHGGFTLHDARRIVPYLASLGVSHVYSSPVFTARPNSTHGYDVTDPTAVNPEIGGEQAFRALVDTLHQHDMGYVLDIVPNHMGIGSHNPYWDDVLANGRQSRYAHWFDIDWEAPDPALRGRVLVPVLGAELDAVIARGEISIERDNDHVARVTYFENSFPLSAETAAEVGEGIAPDSADARRRIRDILDRQHYSLAWWRRASKEVNYRRFFDINELAALRVEDPRVFEETHARVLEWVADGSLDGIRIDHIDGLFDPQAYLLRLRTEVTRRRGAGFPIFVEKILSSGEQLRTDWPVQGTTGYEVLNDIESLFIDAEGFARIEDGYRSIVRDSGMPHAFARAAIEGKLRVLRGPLSADVARLTRLLLPVARSAEARLSSVRGSDGTMLDAESLTVGIVECIACLPVYRTYLDGGDGSVSAADAEVLDRTFALARERANAFPLVLDLLSDIMLPKSRPADIGEQSARRLFVRRLQQTSAAAMAKGVEDTAHYLYIPLVSRDEVGESPERSLADAVTVFHDANRRRAERWRENLVCTNTHDTKRSAGVRARLDVLAEIPDRWLAAVQRWRALNAMHGTTVGGRIAPDANTEYLFYQTLLGIWPFAGAGNVPPQTIGDLHLRLEAYMLKAAREGKARTSWTDPDEQFERALKEFIHAALFESPEFIEDVAAFARRITRSGLWNALARTLLHLTVPGVPDLYQGDEQWTFSLVDPDNRRPVDYDDRHAMLAALGASERWGHTAITELLSTPEDSRVKTHVILKALGARRDHFALFAEGRYVELAADGLRAEHVVAFARVHGGEAAVVVVPRLVACLTSEGAAPIGEAVWGETTISLPPELQDHDWKCALTGVSAEIDKDRRGFPLAGILRTFPSTLLLGVDLRREVLLSASESGRRSTRSGGEAGGRVVSPPTHDPRRG